MRFFIKVTFNTGDWLTTSINGTKAEILRYYIGNEFNLGGPGGEDRKATATNVEFIMDSLTQIMTKSGKVYDRVAWTGGDTPDRFFEFEPVAAELIEAFYQEQLADSGGLDLWECAGTTSAEREKMFRNNALLDAWRTLHP